MCFERRRPRIIMMMIMMLTMMIEKDFDKLKMMQNALALFAREWSHMRSPQGRLFFIIIVIVIVVIIIIIIIIISIEKSCIGITIETSSSKLSSSLKSASRISRQTWDHIFDFSSSKLLNLCSLILPIFHPSSRHSWVFRTNMVLKTKEISGREREKTVLTMFLKATLIMDWV